MTLSTPVPGTTPNDTTHYPEDDHLDIEALAGEFAPDNFEDPFKDDE